MSKFDKPSPHLDAPQDPAPSVRAGTFLVALALSLALGACTSTDRFIDDRPPAWADTLRPTGAPSTVPDTPADGQAGAIQDSTDARDAVDPAFYKPGTGKMMRKVQSGRTIDLEI